MTPRQKALVVVSFEQVRPIAAQAGQLFYRRLFELDPSLRELFHGDMEEQVHKLMAMLQLAVANLNNRESFVPAMERLGRRHNGYGVQREHYVTVGAALIWTLEQGLGAAFTPEVREAWTEAYNLIAALMQEGAMAAAA